jgi:hypothetical protein
MCVRVCVNGSISWKDRKIVGYEKRLVVVLGRISLQFVRLAPFLLLPVLQDDLFIPLARTNPRYANIVELRNPSRVSIVLLLPFSAATHGNCPTAAVSVMVSE